MKKEEPKKEEAKAAEVKKEEAKAAEEKTEEKEEVGSTQCTELTKSGERCKKKTKLANGKCKQHGGK